MRKLKVWAGVVVGVAVIMSGSVLAYDLPRVIGEFRFNTTAFCCIGDQNGDGRADFLVPNYDSLRLEVYFGGDSLGGHYEYSIPQRRGNTEQMVNMAFLGRLMPDHNQCFATRNWTVGNQTTFIDYYPGGEGHPENPWLSWSAPSLSTSWRLPESKQSNPIDFNGDGYDDLIALREDSDSSAIFEAYFGGASFDSIPDWTVHMYSSADYGGVKLSSNSVVEGYDVNNDGFQDFIIRAERDHDDQHRVVFYSLFLGGNPPDTIPAFTLWDRSIQGRMQGVYMDEGFALLSDVNDDGYDDWAIYWSDSWPEGDGVGRDAGVFLFYGGDEIDAEPDVMLPGARQGGTTNACRIAGGDFNGDGVGDITLEFGDGGPPGFDELDLHFGSRWFDTERDIVFTSGDFQNRYGHFDGVGAVGDYNGDGADDFVIPTSGNIKLIVLAGSRGWRVDAPKDPIPQVYDYGLKSFPNPFNKATTIKFHISIGGTFRLEVIDLTGRSVATLHSGRLETGEHSFEWTASAAGVYWIVISSEQGVQTIAKAVCLP